MRAPGAFYLQHGWGVIAMAVVVTMIIDIDHMVHEPPPLLRQGATWDGRISKFFVGLLSCHLCFEKNKANAHRKFFL